MDLTTPQRLAHAEAVARRWFRALESLAGTEASDELFGLVHRRWVATERMASQLRTDLGARAPASQDGARGR